jgi:hypothetical protein
MTYKELEENQIYYCDWGSTNYKYIFRKAANPRGTERAWTGIELSQNSFFKYGGDFTVGTNFREATKKEKEHFLKCEKAGRFVSCDYNTEILQEPLIFN